MYRMKKIFLFSLIIPVTLKIIVLSLSGCATIVPPQGGARDSIPPQLMKASPVDSTRNFTGNKIVFTFDEYIDVQNIQQQMLVSPSPLTNPSVDFRLNTLTVKIKDTLEPNTTYSINFGDAIKDYTEGNPLKGFTYTFSTGRYIDSLELTGSVLLAETGKTDTTLILMLHTSPDDSAVSKDKPRYVAKQDSRGNFIFKNLPPRTFYLYALKDDGGTRRYLKDNQLFAFADKPVVVDGKTAPVTLYAYVAKPAAQQTAPVSPINLSGPGRRKNTDGVVDNRLKYLTNLSGNQQDLLGQFVMSFDIPLKSFDSTKIRLYTDTTFIPATGYSFQKDSTNKKITLLNEWKENTTYNLIMDKDFAMDTSGKKLLKTDTLKFKTKKLSEYGSLKLKLRNLELTKNPVLQFILNNVLYQSVPLTTNEFSQTIFFPGEFELRILFDENKNGIWDPGEFFKKHKQPEIVKPIERRVIVKPNFQNDYEIAL